MFGLFKKQQTSTYQSPLDVLKRLQEKSGITQGQLHGEHLKQVYRKLKRYPGTPDFSHLDSILGEEPGSSTPRRVPSVAAIVETRRHPALAAVVKNVIEVTGLHVQLFHGCANLDFIEQELKGHIAAGEVTLTALHAYSLDATGYNTLLLSRRFWKRLMTRGKVLVFQTDALLCKNSPFKLDDFIQFDYIGAKWKRERPVGLLLDGGNGGLSLRDWAQSYECLRRFPPENWPSGEDGYFAFHLDLMGAKVARSQDCARFATQDWFLEKSFGAHQITRLSEADQKRFLEYCPQAAFLLESKVAA